MTKKGDRCLLKNVRSSDIVLLISGLNCPLDGSPDTD